MCIICVKPSYTSKPSESILQTMWNHNKDGAGFMYADGGKVYIRKGFMHYEKFKKALDKVPEHLPIVMHFRIATHGGINPGMCHPFPLSEDVKHLTATNYTTDFAIAHNGIIPIEPRKGLSDTAEYIASQIYPLSQALPGWYQNPHALRMVENAIHSRMAFLSGKGEIVTIGNGWMQEDGILYSNGSYIPWDYGFSVRKLMPLYSDDCYLSCDGDLLDAEDTAIDASGKLYAYDYEEGAYCMAGWDAVPVRHNGTPIRFNPDYAYEMDVIEGWYF